MKQSDLVPITQVADGCGAGSRFVMHLGVDGHPVAPGRLVTAAHRPGRDLEIQKGALRYVRRGPTFIARGELRRALAVPAKERQQVAVFVERRKLPGPVVGVYDAGLRFRMQDFTAPELFEELVDTVYPDAAACGT